MKNLLKPILVLFAVMPVFVSCSKSGEINFSDEYAVSLQKLAFFKEWSWNSYKYTARGSSWVGSSWETTITVNNGTVTERSFRYMPGGDTEVTLPDEDMEWTEHAGEIGSRTDVHAAAPVTLDKIYEMARNQWLVERKNATFYFETENDGMISLCGYSDNDCADDCFRGIQITSITPLYVFE